MDGFSVMLKESTADDYALALQLQEQFNNENSVDVDDLRKYDFSAVIRPELKNVSNSASNEHSSTVIDNSWELVDPNPDARELFMVFDKKYFWNKLNGVEVRWSSRMTLCAGVCSYEGHGGLCSIRLSEPLLKFRPRKDLIETLLHEMIHAYLFVTNNDRDHNAHGPEFLKHMYRLNNLTGASITVYHTFNDEVDNYRVHWWLCNGPCRKRPPYFGYVKRAMNRPPSSHDPWWSDHQRTCGGVFEKVKEPEKKSRRANSDKDKLPERRGGSCSIDKWFSSGGDAKSADLTAKSKGTVTSGGQSGSIWGEFDCDSVSDAVLLTAADAVEQHEIKTEQRSQRDGQLYFPGRGQKLDELKNSSQPLESIVRRIPGVGVISGRSVNNEDQRRDSPVDKLPVNAAATDLSQRRSSSDISAFACLIPKSGNRRVSSASPIKYESVVDFRKTVGMVLSPPGTEVQVKNFVSVCSGNKRPLPSCNDPPAAPRPKSVRLLSDDDDTKMAVRPLKKLRSDVEDTISKIPASIDSKRSASNTETNNLALKLDRSVSIRGDDDGVVMVNSDSENNGVHDNEQSCRNVAELNAHGCKTPSTARGILPVEASVDEAGTCHVDQAVGVVGSSQAGCVECPVCQIPVPASIINEHLDQCLT